LTNAKKGPPDGRFHGFGSWSHALTSPQNVALNGAAGCNDDVFVIYYLYFSGTGAEVWSKLAEGQRKILYCPFEGKELLDAAFSIPGRQNSRRWVSA
jgi:hypothetical protein